MKQSTLEQLAPVIEVLRAHPALEEPHPGAFFLNGKNFVHFHEEDEGVFADVLLARGRVHVPVNTPAEQAQLLERITGVLDSLERREKGRRRSERKRRKPYE